MPKKKIAPKKSIIPIRLNSEELGLVDRDIANIKEVSGIGFSRGFYAKHAVIEHGRLHELEVALLNAANGSDGQGPVQRFARVLLGLR
jgi:hypothetical protein